jgi:type III secretion protein J
MAISAKWLSVYLRLAATFLSLLLLFGCESTTMVVNQVDEREANEIIVFLASKGIHADKVLAATSGTSEGGVVYWSIFVEGPQATQAMAILNQNGFPRIQGTNLLDLFGKSGLMTSDKEETIRYQAGLAEQIANTIRKIDGVIDATVQLSFPSSESPPLPGTTAPVQKVTAAVYVKHQGILDDPNSHLVTKIKRLVAGSVNGLDLNDVTVISDRSRFTDISLSETPQELTGKPQDYIGIWSIVMSSHSASRFRVLFFALTSVAVLLALLLGWTLWKFYPLLKEKGWKEWLRPRPLQEGERAPPEEKS